MENKQIEALAKLLSSLHVANVGLITKTSSLKEYRGLKASLAWKGVVPITFFEMQEIQLRYYLKSYFENSKRESLEHYLIADVDLSCGWVKLLKFVATKHGEINAETICLKGQSLATLNCFGYRFEHPEIFEDGDREGALKHAYFHIQPIIKNSVDSPLPGKVDWLPDSFPTFFMFASCAYELILYALHSLSGWKILSQYQIDNVDTNSVLARLLMLEGQARVPYPAIPS